MTCLRSFFPKRRGLHDWTIDFSGLVRCRTCGSAATIPFEPLALKALLKYFAGGHVAAIAREGYEDRLPIPSCPDDIVVGAVAKAVADGDDMGHESPRDGVEGADPRRDSQPECRVAPSPGAGGSPGAYRRGFAGGLVGEPDQRSLIDPGPRPKTLCNGTVGSRARRNRRGGQCPLACPDGRQRTHRVHLRPSPQGDPLRSRSPARGPNLPRRPVRSPLM